MSHDDRSEFLFWLLLDLLAGDGEGDPFTGPVEGPPGSRDTRPDGGPPDRPSGATPDEPAIPPSPLGPRDGPRNLPGSDRGSSEAARDRPGSRRNPADTATDLPSDPRDAQGPPLDGDTSPEADPADGGRRPRESPPVARRETADGLRVTADLRGVCADEIQTAIDPESGALVLRACGAFLDRIPLDGRGWTIADVSLNNEVYEVTLAAE